MTSKILLFFLPLALLARAGFHEPWGKDAKLIRPPEKKEQKSNLAIDIADWIIRFHQDVLSPVDGPRSHFRPTSSRYMQLAMQRYGFIKGYLMGCDRLLRENDEKWVYRNIEIDGQIYKFDPAKEHKYAK